MSTYKKLNFADVKDLAPDYGMSEMGEARFARGGGGGGGGGRGRDGGDNQPKTQ
jgi:hypothetical protein